jgi:hypothetical protein
MAYEGVKSFGAPRGRQGRGSAGVDDTVDEYVSAEAPSARGPCFSLLVTREPDFGFGGESSTPPTRSLFFPACDAGTRLRLRWGV